MSRLTVRVELYDAEWDDSESLHSAMGDKGFSRTISGDNGVTYQLQGAEYNRVPNQTTAQVLDDAQVAADSTGRSNSSLVTGSSRRTWSGLRKVGC
jgi:hypothetical protein